MPDSTTPERPSPGISAFNRPFWDYAKQHELRLQRCLACGKAWAPAGPICPFCFSDRYEWAKMSGRGKIASWCVFHKYYHPYFKDKAPYNVAFVELEEGPRLIANILGAAEPDLQTGKAVTVSFEDVDGRYTLPQFRLAGRS